MKKRVHKRRSRLTTTGKLVVAGTLAGGLALALLLFFFLFRVKDVEVIGSTKYSDQEIQKQVMQEGILTSNTLLIKWLHHHVDVENVKFVNSFDLEMVNRNKIRIHVNEKKIIGYVIQGNAKLYFDKDGMIVEQEALETEERTKLEKQAAELEELKKQAEQEEARKAAVEALENLEGENGGEEQQEETDPSQIETINPEMESEEAEEEPHQITVTDVPRIVGLYKESKQLQLNKKIPVPNDAVFNTILGLTRIVEKNDILPELVYIDEEYNITLVYQDGAILCQLGKDTLLEEKITRVAAIMPKLKVLTGILHLEDYTTDTTNIVFSRESLYTLKKMIADAEGIPDAAEETQETQPEDGEGTPPETGSEAPEENGSTPEANAEDNAEHTEENPGENAENAEENPEENTEARPEESSAE